MPASIELSNYYFHKISSFRCINARLLLLTADDWWPRLRKIAETFHKAVNFTVCLQNIQQMLHIPFKEYL